MYRTPVASPSKTARRFSQDSPSPSPKREEKQEVSKLFINRTQVKRRSIEIKKKYDTKLKIGMMNETTQELLKQAMQFFGETAETVYGQMRRDVKLKLEEIADKGLATMFEISRRLTGQGEEGREGKEGSIEIQLKEMREEMRRNMEEWRNKKEKEDEKRQEVEEIIINTREEMREITKRIETSEDNIVAEVVDLERKIKETKRTHRKIEKEEGREEEKEGEGMNEQRIEEIKKVLIDLKGYVEEKWGKLGFKYITILKATNDIQREVMDTNKQVKEHLLKMIENEMKDLEETIQRTKEETIEKLNSIDGETHEEEIIKGLTREVKEISTVLEGKVNENIEKTRNDQEKTTKNTYASITKTNIPQTMHSIILESENKNDTAEELIQKAKVILEPTSGEIKIDKIRKVKDQRVLIGCVKEKEIDKIKNKLEKEQGIKVEKVTNKNPLVIVKDVPFKIKEEELLQLITNQNKEIFNREEEKDMKVKFRKKAINHERCHAVIQVKPAVWRAMTGKGHLYIEMERLKVEDQSPLIQCTRCLGFGHGIKFCQESASRCSQCGDLHLRANCPEREAGRAPRCCNCAHAGSRPACA